MKIIQILLVLLLTCSAEAAELKLLEGLLGKVGDEPVRYSDLVKYQAVEEIMHCTGLRTKPAGKEKDSIGAVLNSYINEELIYLEAITRQMEGSQQFRSAIKTIRSYPACLNRWRALGKKYAALYGTERQPHAGEGMLVRELEKRLLVDRYAAQKLGGDRESWLSEARIKTPVKSYLE